MSLFDQFRRVGPLNVVLVQTKTGNSIKGALVENRRDALVLRAAAVLTIGVNNAQTWEKAIGDLVIPMQNVDYFQQALSVEVLD